MADDPYRGALGAFPYAVRASDSWAFRAYGVVAALATAGIAVLFALSLVVIVASTVRQAASVTLVRAFVLVLMLAVLVPTVAPVLLVARRHRLGRTVDPRYDGALAIAGFAFLAGLYLGLVVSAPDTLVGDRLRPLGVVPPGLAALAIWLVHRRLGSPAPTDAARTPEGN